MPLCEFVVEWATTLAGLGVYTSHAFATDTADVIVGSIHSDVDGSLAVQQSNDGTKWDIAKTIPYVGGTEPGIGPVEILAKYGRVVYTNGAVIQGHFRLYVLKKRG